jgi:hypothetical protein
MDVVAIVIMRNGIPAGVIPLSTDILYDLM